VFRGLRVGEREFLRVYGFGGVHGLVGEVGPAPTRKDLSGSWAGVEGCVREDSGMYSASFGEGEGGVGGLGACGMCRARGTSAGYLSFHSRHLEAGRREECQVASREIGEGGEGQA